MEDQFTWCLSVKCEPESCFEASVCPFCKQKRFFRLYSLILILTLCFGFCFRQGARLRDQSEILVIMDRGNVSIAANSKQEGALPDFILSQNEETFPVIRQARMDPISR